MPDTEYSEHVIQSGQSHIVLSVWEPREPEAVVIFIPATMIHPLVYESLLLCFAEQGFAVVGLHPVGHGKSPRDVKRYSLRDIVQNGCDAVSFALERYALPVIVMGSSQGGTVAAAIAAADERVAAVFAHTVMLSELSDSIEITRFRKWLRYVYRPAKGLFKIFAFFRPDLELPSYFYLDPTRISADTVVWEMLANDELCLTHYSVHFLASLFTTRFHGLTDGSIRCPLYMMTDSGDKLFPETYIKKVFEHIRAQRKEMITFHFGDHMFMFSHPREVCEILINTMRLYKKV